MPIRTFRWHKRRAAATKIARAWRSRRSKPRFGKKRVLVNRALQPIAQRYICKSKYAEYITTSALGVYQFNLNSIFDPNRSGGGHQPYAHDTLQTLYNRYRVISCGYRITAVQTATGVPIQLAAVPSNEVLTFTQISEMKEQPRAKYVMVSPGAPACVLKGKVYIPSLFGRNKSQYMADDRYQAVFGADPSELAILNIKTQTIQEVDSAFVLNVVLEYTYECFDMKNLAQS